MQSLIKDPLLDIKKKSLIAKLDYTLDKKKLFNAIDRHPETSGAGVIYIDSNLTIVVLRKFKATCRINPINIFLREPLKSQSTNSFTEKIRNETTSSVFHRELLSMSLSCAGAAIGWFGVIASGATVPLTGPVGVTMTYVTHAATLASTAQCLTGVTRVALAKENPKKLDALNDNEWYQNTMTALDYISLAGAATSGYQTMKMIKSLNATTGKSIREVLKGLSRQERAMLTREIARKNLPNISNKAYKQLVRAGLTTKRYSSKVISSSVAIQITDAVGAAIAITGSAYSGEVKSLAVGIYEELSVEY
ncbi:hypothetical protein HC752_18610 [Vibrio sp. S9_S30]|uniref:hypothetical protein n=1 Tax=Vibrio sp. S9_S30 TaxID=2720226 RepID=UPI00167FEB21|nr:hypothetical protein [Vibrio sp. S9_S30]